MSNIVIVGAARGLGLALAGGLIGPDDRAWLVSPNEPALADGKHVVWVPVDLANDNTHRDGVAAAIGEEPVHTLVYNSAVWEDDRFDRMDVQKLTRVLDISLSGAIQIIHRLHDNIVAGRGNIVLIGSTCGLDNEGATCVAYTAAKFGLRGAAHALRSHFRSAMVRVTCVNPGSMATDTPLGDAETALQRHGSRRIPVDDVVSLVKCVLSLSPAACVKEISLPATLDTDV
ncbi:SDR family NAD(P)-dependent oxidoreductase [Nocardiopsis sp. FR6]|uniref:SDR family NAD(P)-dependent oxidoreductase n=1 Tax=Nocardiopsis sp. FR6 TaxID=2605986 RepID=UPI00135C3A40|nr:SDR family oxidoreductase [Nocardiopsis sp. FR6]